MYLEHFGLTAPPFRITPHPEFFFEGARRGETLAALVFAIQFGEGLMTVTGEVGSGKTMLCRVLAERLPEKVDVVYIATPSLSPSELLLTIADDLGVTFEEGRPTSRVRLLQQALIERYAQDRQVVILIDEAHAMPEASLEEIRLLSNLDHGHHKLLQIVLFGQPELNQRLEQPELRQLRERITYRFELGPLAAPDVSAYIDWRLRAAGYTGATPFCPAALRLISQAANGLTRRINILADKSLLAAYAENKHEVSSRHAKAAIRDCGFRLKRTLHWALTGGALATAAALALFWTWRPANTAPAASNKALAAASKTATARPETASKAQTASAPAVASKPAPSPVTASAPTPQVDNSKSVKASLALLEAAPSGATAVMLASADQTQFASMQALFERARRALPEQKVLLLPAKLKGKAGWGVFYGFFPNRTAAHASVEKLPADLRRTQPFVRTATGMQNEIRTP